MNFHALIRYYSGLNQCTACSPAPTLLNNAEESTMKAAATFVAGELLPGGLAQRRCLALRCVGAGSDENGL